MPITLSAQAQAQRILEGVHMVWMVDADLDEYGLSTITKLWATRGGSYTIGANVYTDLMLESGAISFGWSRVNARGGYASVANATLKLRDEEDESAIADLRVVQNDRVIFYAVFVNGAEVLSDRIELFRGVVERHKAARNVWEIGIKDNSRSLIKPFPNTTLDPAHFPGAYEPEAIIPQAFGNLNHGPDDGDGLSAVLAPVRMTNKWTGQGTTGARSKTLGTVFQWYSEARRLAECLNTTDQGGGIVSINDTTRRVVGRPFLALATNDPSDWQDGVDGDASTSVAVGAGENLDVVFSGSPKLGKMTAIAIEIIATGSYTYTVKDDTTIRHGPTGATGNTTITLTLSEWVSWELSLMNTEIDGSGDCVIKDMKWVIDFNDFNAALDDSAPDIWQSVVGYEDQTANYNDGSVISGVGDALRNPAYQMQAIVRDTNFLDLPSARLVNGWAQAVTSRAAWNFDMFIRDANEEGFLDVFGLESGLHFFPEEGGFSVAAMDKTRLPTHFFHGDWDMPAKNGLNPDPGRWVRDFEVKPVDASQIINEFHLRFRRHGPSDTYRDSLTASGQHRLTGVCSTTAGGAMNAPGSLFVTNDVAIDEQIYIAGDTDYKVVSRVGEEDLTIEALDGAPVSANVAGTAFYLGPNIDGTMKVSQLSFKRVNALGIQQGRGTDDGGYKSDFIVDPATAALFLTHVKEWFAFPRDICTFPLLHSAIDLQLGDVIMLENAKLRASKRPVAMTLLTASYGTSDTVLSVTAGTAGLLRDDDHVLFVNPSTLQPEMTTVASVDVAANTITVVRGQRNTQTMALVSGWTVYSVTAKWMVIGKRPMTPDDPYVRIQAIQMPSDYLRVGRVVYEGYPGFLAATDKERLQSGWATLRNGKVLDLDPDSNLSYVGPDSGIYTIV